MTLATTKINQINKNYKLISSKTNSQEQLHGVIYGVIDIEKFNELLSSFRIALTKKVLASKYVKFHILPHKRKIGKATIFAEHIVPTLWVYHFYSDSLTGYDSFFKQVGQYIYKHGYNKKVERTRILESQKLLESNAKKCFSFTMHANDLIAIDRYIRSIIKEFPSV